MRREGSLVDALGDSDVPTTARTGQARPAPARVGFTIRGPLERAQLPGLCDRLQRLLRLTAAVVVDCDTDRQVRNDAVTVDALARLQLTAAQSGASLVLSRPPAELRDLMAFMALDVVLGPDGSVT
jgi:ABC-type transporter Mla MlaB component